MTMMEKSKQLYLSSLVLVVIRHQNCCTKLTDRVRLSYLARATVLAVHKSGKKGTFDP